MNKLFSTTIIAGLTVMLTMGVMPVDVSAAPVINCPGDFEATAVGEEGNAADRNNNGYVCVKVVCPHNQKCIDPQTIVIDDRIVLKKLPPKPGK